MRILLSIALFIPYFMSFFFSGLSHSDALNDTYGRLKTMEADTLLEMERTVCFGTCPAYELTIQKDGKVTFLGKEFVEHKGETTGMMSRENLNELIKIIHESHFMKIPSSPECESRYTDMPSVFLTIQLDGKQHSVSHYHGCKGFEYEEELYELEEAIDSLAGTEKWIGQNN